MISDSHARLVSRTLSQDITGLLSCGYNHGKNNKASTPTTTTKKTWWNSKERLRIIDGKSLEKFRKNNGAK